MSRIHEALQKARQQQVGDTSDLPNIEDIIAAKVSIPEPEKAGDIMSDAVPSGMLEDTRAPLLANCPRHNWPIHGRNLVFLADAEHAGGQEQFRTLRSRLYQMRRAGSLQVLVISSAVPGEGKSFVSANLSHAFAMQSEKRVLVIDADMRRAGGLSSLLESPTSPGLSDYLLGEASAEEIIQTGSLENLYLIPCGKRVSKSGELVGNSRFGSLIEQLRTVFDWIIIDTPPVVPIVDARTIAELSDGVLLVVNATSTLAHLAKRAMQEFRRDHLLGVVLNRTSEASASYYSAYGYGYGSEDLATPAK